jgi:predicted nucleic acid-binding protein
MSVLLDTSILLRAFDRTHHQYGSIRQAIRNLWKSNESLVVTVQNIDEFWNVSTRPIANNGFGLSPLQVQRRIETIERFCSVVTESVDSYRHWKELVAVHGIVGVSVHDARLVAVMHAS